MLRGASPTRWIRLMDSSSALQGQTALSSSAGSRPRDCNGHFLTGRILADCLTFRHLGGMFWVVTLLKDGSDPGLALSAGSGMVIGNLALFSQVSFRFVEMSYFTISKSPPDHHAATVLSTFCSSRSSRKLYWKTSK